MRGLRSLLFGVACFILSGGAAAQEFDIRQGDMVVRALNFGQGEHVVIALHGNRQNRTYFKGIGDEIARGGFRVIAIDWPGSAGGGHAELAAALKMAREQGAKRLSLLGFSRGAELAVAYANWAGDGEFDTLVMISCGGDQGVPLTRTKKLFIYNRHDPIARWQADAVEKSAEPKQVIELGGSGHGIGALVEERPDLVQVVIAALKR